MIKNKTAAIIIFSACLMLLGIFSLSFISKNYFVIDEWNYLQNGKKLWQGELWSDEIMRFHPPFTFYLHGWTTTFLARDDDAFLQLKKARLTMFLLLFIFAGLLFYFSKKLSGRTEFALLSLFLFSCHPEILAHGNLITADLSLALFVFLFVITFYEFLREKDWRRTILSGLTLGLALLTKYPAIFLLPIAAIVYFTYLIYKKYFSWQFLGQFFTILALAVLLVNLGYRFYGSFQKPEIFVSKLFKAVQTQPVLSSAILLFPKPFIQGCDFQLEEAESKKWPYQFFLGQHHTSGKGVWYFFMLTFIFKTPMPLLMLMVLALIFDSSRAKNKLLSFLILGTVFFYWFYLSFLNNLQIGFRYFLMVHPLLIFYTSQVLAGRQKWLCQKRITTAFFLFLCLWYFWGTLKISPHFLAYANELIGGPKQAWKYWADSTLDWGQDTLTAQEYFREHPEIQVDPQQPVAGRLAVSVQSLNLVHYDDYLWLRLLKKEPIDNIGYTWLIFDISPEDVKNIPQ